MSHNPFHPGTPRTRVMLCFVDETEDKSVVHAPGVYMEVVHLEHLEDGMPAFARDLRTAMNLSKRRGEVIISPRTYKDFYSYGPVEAFPAYVSACILCRVQDRG